jgi:hypothetical protein
MDHRTETPVGNGHWVKLTLNRHAVALEPALPLVESLLSVPSTLFQLGGRLGYRHTRKDVEFFTHDEDGRLIFGPGLAPRLKALLEDCGYKVEVIDLRPPGPKFPINAEALQDVSPAERAVLETVARSPRGQIEVRNWRDAARWCVLITRSFIRARSVVAVPTKTMAWRMWRELDKHFVGPVGLVTSGVDRVGDRCVVCTIGRLGDAAAWAREILLLPHAEETAGNRACSAIIGGYFPQVYGFVTPGPGKDIRTVFRLEALVGPLLHRLRRPTASVRVQFARTPSCRLATTQSALERKRACWHNAVRNQAIVELARALVSRDVQTLSRFGLGGRAILPANDDRARKLTILVESTEHGRELRARLPGWRMLDALPKEATEPTSKDEAEAPCPGTRVIITTARAAIDGIDADVLIRATGGPWPLHMNGFPPVLEHGQVQEVLLIDFEDTFDKTAKADTRQRMMHYQMEGMQVTGKDFTVR